MASKFQNRLVGTVILVAVGVIILPGLLDGKKKHYKEEFAAIPLVPKPGDQQDSDLLPPVTQPLPSQPPQGAANAIASTSSAAEQNQMASRSAPESAAVTPPVRHSEPTPAKSHQAEPQKTKAAEPEKAKPATPKAKPAEQPKPVESRKPVEAKPVEAKPVETRQAETKPAETKAVEQPKSAEQPKPAEQSAPAGQAYVVQLGALKNAAKVNEIVAKLRLSGYRAFTVPSTPVQGQITRIYVGPDASKARLQAVLPELQSVAGLSGVVKPYSVR